MLLFLPFKVLADEAGNIYVIDTYDRNVKRFTKEGKLTTRYGYGRGRGPGEFSNPTDFDIATDGSVWVCDPINGNLTIFHENGTLKNTIRGTNEMPLRVVLNNGSFVVRPSSITKHLFSLYSAKGNLIERFGSFFDDQYKIEMALDGFFARGANNMFVYTFHRIGMFVIYHSNSTTPLLIAQTINYKGLPEIVTRQVGDSRIYRVDPKAPYATLSASIVHDEIHLLVGSDNEPNKSIVDVYNLNTGYYRHSYDLPSDVKFAHVTKDRIYTIIDVLHRRGAAPPKGGRRCNRVS